MATPQWDKLHLRLAAGARDGLKFDGTAVGAGDNGKDYSVTDRDAYLNQAYQKYLLLAISAYKDNLDGLRLLFQSLIKSASVASTAGVISTGSITDFGMFINLAPVDVGVTVHRKTPNDFYSILYGVSDEITATSFSRFCLPTDSQILIAPSTDASSYILNYMILPVTITRAGSTDITLAELHFDVIVDIALWYIYKDKQEFDIAASYLKDAYETSPFKLNL